MEKRHHKAGIAEVEKMWRHKTVKATYLHIISDLSMDNWKIEDGIPEDEDDYVRMALY